MTKSASVILVCLSLAGACHRPPHAAPAVAMTRDVFADSAYHALMCEAPRNGESWRTSCQPKDQRADLKFYAKPPR